MRRVLALATCVALCVGSPARAGKSAPRDTVSVRKAAVHEGWPDSRAGELGYGWVVAFSSGEKEYREFMQANLSAASLEKKGMSARMESYRSLREKYGKLVFSSVVGEKPGELTVKLMGSDGTETEFVFTIEPETPFKLVSIGVKQFMSHGGGMFHH
jgi:hypothetical protein